MAKGDRVAYRSGTAAIVVLVTPSKIYCANIGDSRAVLCRNNTAEPLSHDHKPEVPTEKERIEKAGGYVH